MWWTCGEGFRRVIHSYFHQPVYQYGPHPWGDVTLVPYVDHRLWFKPELRKVQVVSCVYTLLIFVQECIRSFKGFAIQLQHNAYLKTVADGV